MNQQSTISFDRADLLARLESMSELGIDSLSFGVIGFTGGGIVCRYNDYEAKAAVREQKNVLGHELFTVVAPCMNNYLIAQRFEDAGETGISLDETIDYVLTWKMRPIKVKLRMLFSPDIPTRYVLIHRLV